MNQFLPILITATALLLAAAPAREKTLAENSVGGTGVPVAGGAEVAVYFSPQGGCTEAVVRELARAQRSVRVQAYSFTSVPIAKALLAAHQRGVRVEVLLDRSQRTEKYSSATFLANSGIIPQIDAAHAIAHNKVMIIDNQTVVTGSFNFTKAAEEKNAENLLVITSPKLAQQYNANWEAHLKHCEPYTRPQSSDTDSAPRTKAR